MEPIVIQLVLMEGDPDGVVLAEIPDWSGQVAAFPRDRVGQMEESGDFDCPGIYILIGEGQGEAQEEQVYVGESESLFTRIKQHLKSADKTFWKKVVILKSSSGVLNKAHVKSLESRILRELDSAGVVTVVNQNKLPSIPHLAHHDKISVERYLKRFKLILKSLGMHYFNPGRAMGLVEVGESQPSVLDYSNPIFEMKSVGISALGRIVGDQFVVAKGSTLRVLEDSYYSYYALQMISSNIITQINGNIYSFTRDVAFTSPSIAASIIAGNQRSGWTAWRVISTKITMRQWSDRMHSEFGIDLEHPSIEDK